MRISPGEDEWLCDRDQGMWVVFCSGKSDGTDVLAQHTLLRVCHHMAAVPVKGTTQMA